MMTASLYLPHREATDTLRQVAFTIKEARELMRIPHVGFHPVDLSLIPPDLKKLPRAPKRLMELLLKGSGTAPSAASKTWSADFCLSPRQFLQSMGDSKHVGSTEFEQTSLSDPFESDAKALPTGHTFNIPSSIVFRSIGYKSEPLPGFEEAGILFDDRGGIIKNDGLGRVLQAADDNTLHPAAGLYCSGWVKRGPTGVIASTMEDAFATADSIVQDWLSGELFLGGENAESKHGWDAIQREVGKAAFRVVTWPEWEAIDRAEKDKGQQSGKKREKFTSIAEMLQVLD